MSAINKQIQTALSNSLAASRLSPPAYTLARQLGLYEWLASKTSRFGSVGQEAIMSPEFLHREFWHSYDLVLDGRPMVLQVWIVQTAVLAKEYPYEGAAIMADPNRPNLFIAQQSGLQRRVILEIDADETAVLHAIIRQKSIRHAIAIADLTDDTDLQAQVKQIYSNIIQRLQTRNIPFTTGFDNPTPNVIYLPFPTPESEKYPEQLGWLLQHSDLIEVEADAEVKRYHEPQWQPQQKGDVARRLRQLNMIKDVGSIRGVYEEDDVDDTPHWEKMDILERAIHEQRVVGYGTLELDEKLIHMITIMRDRLHDAVGQHFLIRCGRKQFFIAINVQGANETLKFYTKDMMTTFNVANPATLTPDDLQEACDTWEAGLRVEAWLRVLFDVVEAQQGYVTPKTIARTLHIWSGIEAEEETTS